MLCFPVPATVSSCYRLPALLTIAHITSGNELETFQMDLYDDPVITRDCSSFVSTNAWKLFQNEQYFTNLSLKHLCYIWRHDIDFKGRNKLPELHIYVGAIK